MFRKMLRFKQQIPETECIRILKEEPRGVLSVLGEKCLSAFMTADTAGKASGR